MGSSSFALGRPACLRRANALSRVSSGLGHGNARARCLPGRHGNRLITPPRARNAGLGVCSTGDPGLSVGRGRLERGCRWGIHHSVACPRAAGRGGADEVTSPTSDPPSMMLFSDFIASKSIAPPSSSEKTAVSDVEMDALIERTSGVLKDAVEALQQVRAREAGGAKGAMAPPSERADKVTAMDAASGADNGVAKSASGRRPSFLSGSTVGRVGEVGGGGGQSGSSAPAGDLSAQKPSPSSSPSSSSIDGWFRGKGDAGPLMAQSAAAKASSSELKFKEKEQMPSVLEFTARVEAPEASVMGMNEVFPEHLALRFQSEVFSDASASSPVSGLHQESTTAEAGTSSSTTTSGEEFGPNGYWHRWTEVSGQNEKGTVVWTERWWEVSDWSGMKELGAEKYGMNTTGC